MRLFRILALVACAAGCESADPCADGTPGTVCRVAGTGGRAFDGDGKTATDTALYMPSQVRRGPDGLIYLADFNNQRIRRIENDGTISTIAGSGEHLGATVGVTATDSPLENPVDFDFLPDGRLVFVSSHDPRVLVIDFDGTIQRLAGDGNFPAVIGNEGDNGPAIDARFVSLSGIAVAPDGTIYVADGDANRLRVITPDGIIRTLAGTGAPGYVGDGQPAITAKLDAPSALTLDGGGNLFVADVANCLIRKITPDGLIHTVAGTNNPGFSGDGGPARSADLAHADGIAVAADGTLFLGDRYNNRLRMVAPDGTITTVAGTGMDGGAGDGGPVEEAHIGYISRVQIDVDGSILFSDQTNSTVRRLIR